MDTSVKSAPFEAFIPVAEAVRKAVQTGNRTAKKLERESHFNELCGVLRDIGFTRLSPEIKHGRRAIVLEANDLQILRITHKSLTEDRLSAPQVLQPLKTIKYGGNYTIEILPKVNVLDEIVADPKISAAFGITKGDIPKIIKQVFLSSPDNLIFKDVQPSNIGIIRYQNQNVPVILDPGSIVKKPPIWIGSRMSSLDNHVPAFTEYLKSNASALGRRRTVKNFITDLRSEGRMAFPFTEAQGHYVARLGLKYGEYIKTPDNGASEVAEGLAAAGKSFTAVEAMRKLASQDLSASR